MPSKKKNGPSPTGIRHRATIRGGSTGERLRTRDSPSQCKGGKKKKKLARKKKKKLARKPQGKPRIKTQRHVAVRREEGVTPPRSVRLPVASPGSEPDGKKKAPVFCGTETLICDAHLPQCTRASVEASQG